MLIAKTNLELHQILSLQSSNKLSIGFVPTMGALHQGHLNLVKRSQKENDFTVVSIFINPKQFNSTEDFKKYPIKTQEDVKLLESINCNLLYLPNYEEIYPQNGQNIAIDLEELNQVFEGPQRPGHFEGVVSVVYRLFELIKPNKAYFGLKDFQQCKVIYKLKETYFKNIELVFCETTREKNGLAMSSRNSRLSEKGKILASQIYKALLDAKSKFMETNAQSHLAKVSEKLSQHNIEVEYFELANAKTLKPAKVWQKPNENVILTAVKIENVRLIDNIVF
ncbi:MAG: pantoate--beta-alanine ligase [Bacteroidota bacterium]|nr:pantoate--beta-alanine ligase [Bacteroidota bacterium]